MIFGRGEIVTIVAKGVQIVTVVCKVILRAGGGSLGLGGKWIGARAKSTTASEAAFVLLAKFYQISMPFLVVVCVGGVVEALDADWFFEEVCECVGHAACGEVVLGWRGDCDAAAHDD